MFYLLSISIKNSYKPRQLFITTLGGESTEFHQVLKCNAFYSLKERLQAEISIAKIFLTKNTVVTEINITLVKEIMNTLQNIIFIKSVFVPFTADQCEKLWVTFQDMKFCSETIPASMKCPSESEYETHFALSLTVLFGPSPLPFTFITIRRFFFGGGGEKKIILTVKHLLWDYRSGKF